MPFFLPVARMVGGSFYTPKLKTEANGQPKIDAKTGKQAFSFDFAVAVAKTAARWQDESWGQTVEAIGRAAYPQHALHPSFAWKIIDGDSTLPNTKNNRPCDNNGYPGNWVIWFSQCFPIQLFNADGTIELTEPDSIVPGYFIEVYADVVGNKPSANGQSKPGVYWNPLGVALAGYGERIVTASRIDGATAGFGARGAPAGASATPVSVMKVPAALGAKVMTPAAQGVTYEAHLAAGWNDQQMIEAGLLVA